MMTMMEQLHHALRDEHETVVYWSGSPTFHPEECMDEHRREVPACSICALVEASVPAKRAEA